MNYYCLIAGLPDLHIDDIKGVKSLGELRYDLLEQLTPADGALLNLLFAQYDNSNLLLYLKNKEAQLDETALLSRDDWAELIALMREYENPSDSRLLPYVKLFYNTYNDEKIVSEQMLREDYLSVLYYQYGMHYKNDFLRKWFAFNLDLKNVLAAIACRKHGFDQRSMVLGDSEIANAIRLSNARDFGLTGVFEQLDVLMRIADEPNLLEREKKIDALKWEWLEENSFFNYFGVEKVLSYVLKVQMIERWKALSVEKGALIFRQILADLKSEVKFEDQ